MKKKIMIMLSMFFLLFFGIEPFSASAKTGDLYNKYKKEIDSFSVYDINKADVELIKKYDYATNSFDCGTFDITCNISGFFFKSSIGAVKGVYNTIQSFVISPGQITGNSTFKNYKNGLGVLSSTMLAIFLLWQAMKLIATRYAGSDDGLIAINDKLILVLVGGILLGIYDNLFNYILSFQQYAVQGILKDTVSMEDLAIIIFKNGFRYGFFIALMLVIILVVFSIAFVYRFVLFGFLYITGVLAIPTIVNDEYNYFQIWLRQMINNGVTLFGQALAFSLGFNALIKNNAFGQGSSFTVAMAFFILALSVPSILGQLGASSGTGRALGSAIRVITKRR